MWANPDYRPALSLRVNEKISIAARHDNRGLVAETWLVVSAQLNRWGAAASTTMIPGLVRIDDLNNLLHENLSASNFDRAFIVLHLHSVIYGWQRGEGWRVVADPQACEREEHRAQMNDLIFNQISRHDRGM